MISAQKHFHLPLSRLSGPVASVVTFILFLLLFVPLWPAITAGLAGMSIVVFGSLFIVLLFTLRPTNTSYHPIIWIGLVVATVGVLAPQIAYFQTAQRAGAQLYFHVGNYLTISGATDIRPTSEAIYKRIGDHELKVAYYSAEVGGERPLVVVLHGGAWRYGSHLETGEWPKILTKAGYHVASVEYRLSTDTYHSWQDTPSDVTDAIAFLKANSTAYEIDKDAFHLLGQSAGGHLALLEAYRTQSVASVTALYAPVDLTFDYITSRDKSSELNFIGGTPAEFPDRYRTTSPLTYISARSPRTLLINGTNDDLVHYRGAAKLSAALNASSVEHDSILIPFTGHSFENQHGGFATQIAHQRVLRFLSE